MAMKGFDLEFRDLVDYILVITDRIWEKRNVGSSAAIMYLMS